MKTNLFVLVSFVVVGCQAANGPGFQINPNDTEDSSASTLDDYNPATDACPPDMIFIKGGTFLVGAPAELADKDSNSRVPIGQVTPDDYCISASPFPGNDQAWPAEGLNADIVFHLDAVVHGFGRRVITGSEYLVAVSTEYNDRYPSGATSWVAANCGSDNDPGNIGDYPCQSRYGVNGLLTFLFWGEVDEEIRDILQGSQDPPNGNVQFVVFGGLDPKDYAYCGDDLWGYQNHFNDKFVYSNERGVLFAASPGWVTTDQQAAYEAFAAAFVASGTSGGSWASVVDY